MSPRLSLPVLDTPPPVATSARTGARPADGVAEYATEERLLPRFHVWTLGCQMNASDSEEMAGALLAAGCPEAARLEEAELIVINSCSIRETAEQKVIGRMGSLGRLKEANPALRVVLTGCSVRADNARHLARRYPAVDLFLRPDEEPELVARLGLAGPTTPGALAGPSFRRVGRSLAATAERLPATRASAVEAGRIARSRGPRAWLPIIYGCDKTCTYCIVPFARGPERSRPFDDILAEAGELAADGVQEVTLLGQNVNSWGHDLPPDARFADVAGERTMGHRSARDGRPDFAALLRAIDGLPGPTGGPTGGPAIPRLRFVTSHPWDLTDRLVAAMAECVSVCEHLHLPVQSGSDEVLRRMGRQYGVAAYRDLVGRLRDAVPGISLTTDVIVGFCGETEAHFEATLALLHEVRFDQVFAAAYSPRPGTPALRLADDVPPAEKRRRLNVLLDLQEAIGRERNEAWLGRRTEVLVEEARPPRRHEHDSHDVPAPAAGHGAAAAADTERLVGRNREHKLVHLDGPARLVGQLVEVVVERAGPYALAGRLSGEPRDAWLPPLVVIAGATATGKTALAVDLALGLPGAEVISADSRQVYRGLDIGTAKATQRERSGVPHHGLDLVDPDEPFTASDFRAAALDALAGIADRGGLAILVGGTGLYLRSVARGLPLDETGRSTGLRAELESRLAADGLDSLVAELQGRDPAAAGRLDLRNPRRVIRALERVALSGSALPPRPIGYPAPCTWLGLLADPAGHRRAIEARVEAQFAAGLLEEARGLRERYPEDLPAFSAMGYREAFDVLAGRRDLVSAMAAVAQRTWAFARRQGTWFRSEPGIDWLEAGEGAAARARLALKPFLRSVDRDGYAGEP